MEIPKENTTPAWQKLPPKSFIETLALEKVQYYKACFQFFLFLSGTATWRQSFEKQSLNDITNVYGARMKQLFILLHLSAGKLIHNSSREKGKLTLSSRTGKNQYFAITTKQCMANGS